MPYIEDPPRANQTSTSTSTPSSRAPHSQTNNNTQHATGYRDQYGHWQPVERTWDFSNNGESNRQITTTTRYPSQQTHYTYTTSQTTPSSTSSTHSSTYTTASASHNTNPTTTPLSISNITHHSNTQNTRNTPLHTWETASQRSGPWDGVGHVLVERSGSRRDTRYYEREDRERRGYDGYARYYEREERERRSGRERGYHSSDDEYY